MLAAIWHIIRDGTFRHGLGPNHVHRPIAEQQARHLATPITKLGFASSLQPPSGELSV
jgi:hypothetical protein